MSLFTTVNEQRVQKDSWGQFSIKGTLEPLGKEHAATVKAQAQQCLNHLEEAVTHQKPLPYSDNGKAKKAPEVPKGQRALPLGPAAGKKK